MLKTCSMLKDDLSSYRAPEMKIKRMADKNEIIRLTKNLYETDPDTPGYVNAGAVCSPSCLSFDYALSYYGLIPEAVYTCTSASSGLRKRKTYKNKMGVFTYQDIPVQAFPFEIRLQKAGNRTFAMASPEKALCNKLCLLKPVRSKRELKYMLFEDLRIDQEEFMNLDFPVLKELCPLYKSTTLNTFGKVIGDLRAESS
ncbi:hypothetical protein [uncultured Faecalibaculum sp.]|uniref:type IV toxin-antitoxin system AbiEi family antitoxin domain-containing protein n=1 Tax=uncultured Faecalibaculum sp. TaxID=1729681 RepID=UPI0025FD528D|nr:hypothetical protein [uncultured Faecalibaculum sp.]